MEPLENFDKMSAFEAFSSNREAEPLRWSGLEPPEILTKMSAFEAFSSNLEARSGPCGWSPQRILTKISAFEAFSSDLIEARPWRGSDEEAEPRKKF